HLPLCRRVASPGRPKLNRSGRRQKVRDKMVAEQQWALRNEGQIHYPLHDVRPPGETAKALQRWQEHELPLTLDCSEYAPCIAAAAGAPDPTGTSFGLRGGVVTGTMLSHSREIGKHELKPGDYVVLRADTGEHACVVPSVDD